MFFFGKVHFLKLVTIFLESVHCSYVMPLVKILFIKNMFREFFSEKMGGVVFIQY